MAFVTDSKLSGTVDLPIALPATTLKQGDWLVVSTVKIAAGQRLTLRLLNIQLVDCSVPVADISATNLIVSSLGLVYAVLRQNYVSGNPGGAGALDSLAATSLGVTSRSIVPTQLTEPGYYSVIVANNAQASTTSVIATGTAIDFKVVVTGQMRLELVGV